MPNEAPLTAKAADVALLHEIVRDMA